ncbi:MATE family efflux transporter [Spongorhabdus nitratireducens]
MRQRIYTILTLGLPIIAGMLSQSLMNLVDTALVGHLGEAALAAVSAGSYAILLMISLMSGLSAAIQAQVARLRGSRRDTESALPVNTGLSLSLWLGLPLVVIGLLLAPWILGFLSPDPAIASHASDYFDIRLLSLPAAAMNLSFRGFWNGSNHPLRFVRILLLVHLLNALLSYLLIYGKLGLPAMGVEGAALGTLVAMYTGALVNGLFMWRDARDAGFLKDWPGRRVHFQLLKLAIPDSIQQFMFSLSLLLLFAILARAGATAMALGHILINVSLLLILPAIGLGMASTTLVSHAIGAGDPAKACRWGREVALVATLGLVVLSLPLWLIPEQIIGLFTSDLHMIDAGIVPLQITGLGIIAEATGIVLTQALLGAGASRTVMMIRFGSQWLVLLPLSWWVVNVLGYGLIAICVVQAIQRGLSSVMFALIWQRAEWLKKDHVSLVH